ncbi:MAG: T9SS type A sorting domain-containing protein [Draconibacterium sp.]|nr:T9SS type A sorting domain-containing protein [Draconibacterium sp.]
MATGINNLEVGGINYDVVFRVQKFAYEIYGPYPGTFDIFDIATEAEDAVDAVNIALNDANATSIGDIDQPGIESPLYNIGYGSVILVNVEFINVWRAGIEGVDWITLGNNQWTYNLDERSWAVFTITTAVDDDVSEIPKAYKLLPNYPNPFNPTTTIQYNVPQESKVTLQVFNVMGVLVNTLVDDVQSAGQNSVMWNGRNNSGQKVSSGVYLYTLTAEGFLQTRTMILLK